MIDPSATPAAQLLTPYVTLVAVVVQLITLIVVAGKWAGRVDARQELRPGQMPPPEPPDDRLDDIRRRIEYLEQNRVTPQAFNDAMARLDRRLDKMGADASNWNTELQKKVGEMSTDVKIMKQQAVQLERDVRVITRRGNATDHRPGSRRDDKT
jgi:hypothetical protein